MIFAQSAPAAPDADRRRDRSGDSRSMTGRHGAEWLFPSQRGGIEGCMVQKKRDRRPLSGTPISFLQGLFAAALFDEVREFLGKTRERISS